VIFNVLVPSYAFKLTISFLFCNIYDSSIINFELIVCISFLFYVILDVFVLICNVFDVILFVFKVILFLFNTLSDCNNVILL